MASYKSTSAASKAKEKAQAQMNKTASAKKAPPKLTKYQQSFKDVHDVNKPKIEARRDAATTAMGDAWKKDISKYDYKSAGHSKFDHHDIKALRKAGYDDDAIAKYSSSLGANQLSEGIRHNWSKFAGEHATKGFDKSKGIESFDVGKGFNISDVRYLQKQGFSDKEISDFAHKSVLEGGKSHGNAMSQYMHKQGRLDYMHGAWKNAKKKAEAATNNSINDSFNSTDNSQTDNSMNDSNNIKDSLNTDGSFNTDMSQQADIDDSFNTDNSVNDSFNTTDSFNTDNRFTVEGDLDQNIGKSGDMTTNIGSNNTFGAGSSIGNDYSVTIGNQNAGNAGNGGASNQGLANMQGMAAYSALNNNAWAKSSSQLNGYGRAAGASQEAAKRTGATSRVANLYNVTGADQTYWKNKATAQQGFYLGDIFKYRAPTWTMPSAPKKPQDNTSQIANAFNP